MGTLFWLISIAKNEALMLYRRKQKNIGLENWDAYTEELGSDIHYPEMVILFARHRKAP